MYLPAAYAYGDDWSDITDHVAELVGELPDWERHDEELRVMDEAVMAADRLLRDNWSKVQTLANALLEHGELSAERVIGLLSLGSTHTE